jgi:hypothetical protein
MEYCVINGIYVASQIPQSTERFFHQSGLFEFLAITTSGIDSFFILGLKNQLYGNGNN